MRLHASLKRLSKSSTEWMTSRNRELLTLKLPPANYVNLAVLSTVAWSLPAMKHPKHRKPFCSCLAQPEAQARHPKNSKPSCRHLHGVHAAYLAQDRDILGDHWMLYLWWWWLEKSVWVDSESAVNVFMCLTRLLTLALFSPTFHRFVSPLLILRGVVVVRSCYAWKACAMWSRGSWLGGSAVSA